MLQCCEYHWHAISNSMVHCICSCTGMDIQCTSYIWSLPYSCLFQLHFALSDASSWCVINTNFNYEEFNNSIVDYFEVTPGPAAKAIVDGLLAWWNKCVFLLWLLLFITHYMIQESFWCTKYGASHLVVPQIGTSVAHLSEHCQPQESQAQAVLWWHQLQYCSVFTDVNKYF